jgi:2-polyprenyl-6-methoxyphenol hydroxylase-like FAD-dependent oxidoreductase
MRIVCVGGGPAGLYFALLMKVRNPNYAVTVVERNPAGATYGWGVVFWDDMLDLLYRNDVISARTVERAAHLWEDQQVRLKGRTAHLGGYGFSIGRGRLLDILAARAAELGIELRYGCEIAAPFAAAADLIVAADGANSTVREQLAADFNPTVLAGRNKYVWLGTRKIFDAFTFAFEHTPAGWIWFHAYPYESDMSTCIVECPPETWAALGFADLTPQDISARLQVIFGAHLDGHELVAQSPGLAVPSPWLTFRQITNATWRSGNVVLIGDAAHTTHFSVGAGTRLAIQDAVELADQLTAHSADLDTALAAYDTRRRAAMRPRQAAAQDSMEWFERVPVPIDVGVVDFAYALWARRGHTPAWRYQLHRATQLDTVRRMRRYFSSTRRIINARRRRRLHLIPRRARSN